MANFDKSELLMQAYPKVCKVCQPEHVAAFFLSQSSTDINQYISNNKIFNSHEKIFLKLFNDFSYPKNQHLYSIFINYCHEQRKGYQEILTILNNEQNNYEKKEKSENSSSSASTAVAGAAACSECQRLNQKINLKIECNKILEIRVKKAESDRDDAKEELEMTLEKLEGWKRSFENIQKELEECKQLIETLQCEQKTSEQVPPKMILPQPPQNVPHLVHVERQKTSQIQSRNEPFEFQQLPKTRIKLGSWMRFGQKQCRLVWTGKRGEDFVCVIDFMNSILGGTDGVFDGQRLYHAKLDNSCLLVKLNELEFIDGHFQEMPENTISSSIDDANSLLYQHNHLGCAVRICISGVEVNGRLCWFGKKDGFDFLVVELDEWLAPTNDEWSVVFHDSRMNSKCTLVPLADLIFIHCQKKNK